MRLARIPAGYLTQLLDARTVAFEVVGGKRRIPLSLDPSPTGRVLIVSDERDSCAGQLREPGSEHRPRLLGARCVSLARRWSRLAKWAVLVLE